MAHPFLSLKDENRLVEFLNRAVECGLQGIETLYPLFTPEQSLFLENLAARYGLTQSGGSDFHGENKPDIHLGTGHGTLNVPLSFATNLRNRP